MTSLVSGYTDNHFVQLQVDVQGNKSGSIPQRCSNCHTPNSADGYFQAGDTLWGVCRSHHQTNSKSRQHRVWWFTPTVDKYEQQIHAGDLVRICSGERLSRKVFMVNQVCRARPSCCLLSNGAYVFCKELIIEGES